MTAYSLPEVLQNTHLSPQEWINHLHVLAAQAATEICKIYHRHDIQVTHKSDSTPLTEADLASHHILSHGLKLLTPNYPVLSEENFDEVKKIRCNWNTYWLIDPLDGTKEFLDNNDEFTINIALIHNHQPVIGCVYIPVTKKCYVAISGYGAFKLDNGEQKSLIREANTSNIFTNRLRIVASRRTGLEKIKQLTDQIKDYEIVHIGSALKLCFIAENKADIYPRFGPTSEWDTAAAHCILKETGGEIFDFNGQALRYNEKSSIINPDFVAVRCPELLSHVTGLFSK